jgi:hypothetical protein
MAVTISRKGAESNRLVFYYGLGVGAELNTFLRPFDHKYKIGFGNDALHYTDRYYKFFLETPFQLHYRLGNRLNFDLELRPLIGLCTIARHSTLIFTDTFSWPEFYLHAIEFNPGFSCTSKDWVFGIRYRLLQIKKIDRIIFNTNIRDNREEPYEWNNPFKLWVSVGKAF